jgi:hypothetical protein
MLDGYGMGIITRNGYPIQKRDCLPGVGHGMRHPAPATTEPFLARKLDVEIHPKGAATFLLNPSPLGKGGCSPGMIVTIDILPKQGWQVDEWVGPVFNIDGKTAQIQMDSSQAVEVRLKLTTPATATPTDTPIPPADTTLADEGGGHSQNTASLRFETSGGGEGNRTPGPLYAKQEN